MSRYRTLGDYIDALRSLVEEIAGASVADRGDKYTTLVVPTELYEAATEFAEATKAEVQDA